MKPGDWVLIVVLVIATVGVLAFGSRSSGAADCRITVSRFPDRTIQFALPEKPAQYEIKGWLGTSTLLVDPVRGVRFHSSPCPNHVCIGTGWVKPPFGVVCVPNGVIVSFVAETARSVDGVTQ